MYKVDGDEFSRQIETVNQRAQLLHQHANQSPWPQPELVADSLEALRVSLEELRVAEEELREQNDELTATRAMVEAERQRYQELFEFAPDGYLVTDADGTIREANRTAAMLLQVPQRFLVGKPLVNFIPKEMRSAWRSQLLELRRSCPLQEWEMRVQPREGEPFYAALSVSVFYDIEGKPVTLRWLLRNITIRKQAEEKIRQIELENLQLIEIARLKSQFMAIVSHELRTPMNAIIGFAQLLLRHPHNQLSKVQASMVERIFNSGKNLLALIEDILDFSQLHAHSLQLKLESIDLAELAIATTEELRSLAIQKNLTLSTNISLNNPHIVNDSIRLRQLLVNLLSNAIKFTATGSVSLDLWEQSPECIAIAVRDTGIGIAEADLSHIFEEFRQLNQTTSRQKGGIGLGLAIANSLVRLMMGKIQVQSKLGEGSTFLVELPRVCPPSKN